MGAVLNVYRSPKMLAVLLLGFSSGLPLALTMGTLQAWLTDAGLDVKTIGALSLIGLPYSYKFLWSPLMDRFAPPVLGRRRGWILLCQLALAGAVAGIAYCSPATTLQLFIVLAVCIAFLSASQDIVIDAYRTELLSETERGPGAGVAILGYRVAMLTSGALALILADHMPWKNVYLIMAAILAALAVVTFFSPEPSEKVLPPRTLEAALVEPFKNFFARAHAKEMLLFVLLYKLGDVMAVALTTKFMLDIGFTKSDIGYVAKGLGLVCSILGSLIGGGGVVRWGLRKSLFYFGILQGISVLCFAVLAITGKNYFVMSSAIGLENFCNGLGNAALVTFLMGLCDKRFTATQYSLLTSIQSLSRNFAGATTGFIVAAVGWLHFFLVCTLLAFPGLFLLLARYDEWDKQKPNEVPPA